MIGQMLVMKSEIEAKRSQNIWGTIFWMFSEIWPTGGWGSIEYGPSPELTSGQVEGGRWKPLQYMLRSSTYADQLAACNDAGDCWVTNDVGIPFAGAVSVRLLNVQTGATAFVRKSMPVELAAGAGVVKWFCAAGDAPSPSKTYIYSPCRAVKSALTTGEH